MQPQDPELAVEVVATPSPVATVFRLAGASFALVNAVRHGLLQDVPCLAFDAVHFRKYTGPLEVEYVAHRVGQIPLAALHDSDGDGALCVVRMAAPSDPLGQLSMVTSGDFTPWRGPDGAAPLVRPLLPSFQVVPLLPGQECKLVARAAKSTARQRGTRWICVHVTTPVARDRTALRVETTGVVTPAKALWHVLRTLEARLRAEADRVVIG
jgi:DNA-directed RNA polymerase alpha subunit